LSADRCVKGAVSSQTDSPSLSNFRKQGLLMNPVRKMIDLPMT